MVSVKPPATWKQLFLSHMGELSKPQFTLSTISYSQFPTDHSIRFPSPRARTCIFRGFWAGVPEHEGNKAAKNPQVYESDLPIFTTDIRMRKVKEIFESNPTWKHGTAHEGTGGGGPVEAVWWIEKVGVQWRIKGDAWVLAEDVNSADKVQQVLRERMRLLDAEREMEWDWLQEVGWVFGAQSPGIKGSFRSPTPGALVTGKPEEGYEVGMKVDEVNDSIARKNFRVVVIRPFEVEATDLSDPKKARRQLYKYQKDGTWSQEELWP